MCVMRQMVSAWCSSLPEESRGLSLYGLWTWQIPLSLMPTTKLKSSLVSLHPGVTDPWLRLGKKKQLNCLKLSRRWWVHPNADIGWPLISYVSSIALGCSEILLAMHKYGNSMSKLLLTQLQEFWTLYLHMTASILTSQRVAMRIQWHNTQVFWNSTCRSPIWAIAVGISWQM